MPKSPEAFHSIPIPPNPDDAAPLENPVAPKEWDIRAQYGDGNIGGEETRKKYPQGKDYTAEEVAEMSQAKYKAHVFEREMKSYADEKREVKFDELVPPAAGEQIPFPEGLRDEDRPADFFTDEKARAGWVQSRKDFVGHYRTINKNKQNNMTSEGKAKDVSSAESGSSVEKPIQVEEKTAMEVAMEAAEQKKLAEQQKAAAKRDAAEEAKVRAALDMATGEVPEKKDLKNPVKKEDSGHIKKSLEANPDEQTVTSSERRGDTTVEFSSDKKDRSLRPIRKPGDTGRSSSSRSAPGEKQTLRDPVTKKSSPLPLETTKDMSMGKSAETVTVSGIHKKTGESFVDRGGIDVKKEPFESEEKTVLLDGKLDEGTWTGRDIRGSVKKEKKTPTESAKPEAKPKPETPAAPRNVLHKPDGTVIDLSTGKEVAPGAKTSKPTPVEGPKEWEHSPAGIAAIKAAEAAEAAAAAKEGRPQKSRDLIVSEVTKKNFDNEMAKYFAETEAAKKEKEKPVVKAEKSEPLKPAPEKPKPADKSGEVAAIPPNTMPSKGAMEQAVVDLGKPTLKSRAWSAIKAPFKFGAKVIAAPFKWVKKAGAAVDSWVAFQAKRGWQNMFMDYRNEKAGQSAEEFEAEKAAFDLAKGKTLMVKEAIDNIDKARKERAEKNQFIKPGDAKREEAIRRDLEMKLIKAQEKQDHQLNKVKLRERQTMFHENKRSQIAQHYAELVDDRMKPKAERQKELQDRKAEYEGEIKTWTETTARYEQTLKDLEGKIKGNPYMKSGYKSQIKEIRKQIGESKKEIEKRKNAITGTFGIDSKLIGVNNTLQKWENNKATYSRLANRKIKQFDGAYIPSTPAGDIAYRSPVEAPAGSPAAEEADARAAALESVPKAYGYDQWVKEWNSLNGSKLRLDGDTMFDPDIVKSYRTSSSMPLTDIQFAGLIKQFLKKPEVAASKPDLNPRNVNGLATKTLASLRQKAAAETLTK